jgi:ornithine cyclodeaminase/alanine dehydrogenase-like protein (mu-crystallin family)
MNGSRGSTRRQIVGAQDFTKHWHSRYGHPSAISTGNVADSHRMSQRSRMGQKRIQSKRLSRRNGSKGLARLHCRSADDLLKECDLIVTTTCARQALLQSSSSSSSSSRIMASRKKSGLHITCIGADGPGKHKLDPKLGAMADLLVADTVQQTVERGEFQKAIAEGLVARDSIVSLGNLLLLANQTNLHRKEENFHRLTIFDSSGVGLQDCVISQLTYDALQQKY